MSMTIQATAAQRIAPGTAAATRQPPFHLRSSHTWRATKPTAKPNTLNMNNGSTRPTLFQSDRLTSGASAASEEAKPMSRSDERGGEAEAGHARRAQPAQKGSD